ncbi:uncharacterized protein LOC143034569 isoform X3 [Oratosquilla oratoria]|uniref:uncharacterized protein LOC143034569 isoform X3 n=1 Tax=Oratosquilla oratoria TaxID=337810 RepID=UPI003F75B43B
MGPLCRLEHGTAEFVVCRYGLSTGIGLGAPGARELREGRIMAEQQFCLRWNNFQANIVSSFESLLDGEEFVDVTLTAEGKSVKAHRVLLSACSPYFRDLFRDLPPHQHPVIVLRDTSFQELKSLLSFIYHGEVNVSQERLGLLLKTAEALRIKGLAQDKKSKDQFGSIGSSPEKEPDESLDKNERERRCGPSSPSLPMSFTGVPVSGMPPSNPLTSLEPPSHKPIGTAAHIIMPSPPSKRRKHLHSPHSAPPPSLVALREPPPPTTSSSSSSSSTALHEEDNAPVGMNLSTTGSTPNAGPLSPRMVPKVEVMEEEGSSSVGRGSGNGGHVGMGDVSDNEADEARSHDGELGELDTSTTSSSDLHGLPPHLSAAVQNFVPYVAAAAAGSSQLDTFPGPSGVLPQASQAGWRGGHPESSDTSAQEGGSSSTMSALENLVGSLGTGDQDMDGVEASLELDRPMKQEDPLGIDSDLVQRLSFHLPEVKLTLGVGGEGGVGGGGGGGGGSIGSDFGGLGGSSPYTQPSRQRCQCPSCGRTLSQRRNLKQHLITTHKMSSEEATVVVKRYNFEIMVEEPPFPLLPPPLPQLPHNTLQPGPHLPLQVIPLSSPKEPLHL